MCSLIRGFAFHQCHIDTLLEISLIRWYSERKQVFQISRLLSCSEIFFWTYHFRVMHVGQQASPMYSCMSSGQLNTGQDTFWQLTIPPSVHVHLVQHGLSWATSWPIKESKNENVYITCIKKKYDDFSTN